MQDEVPRLDDPEAIRLNNVRAECTFSLLNGIFLGIALYFSPVVAKTCLHASPTQQKILLAVLICAFPCGAFLGSLWAKLGQKWGMKQLVLRMGVVSNLLVFLVPMLSWLPEDAVAIAFTALITVSVLLYSAMKMGQSSLYRCTYPAVSRGRVLGWFVTLSFLSAVPAALLAGCLVDPRCRPENYPWLAPLFFLVGDQGCQPENYRWLYPFAGCCGLLGCWFYRKLILLEQPSTGEVPSFKESWVKVGQVLRRDKSYFWFQVGYYLSGTAFFLSVHVMIDLCKEDMHFSASQLTVALVALPQLMLALSSWMWGRVLDRLGIIQLRVIIAIVMTIYLACYLGGLWGHIVWLIYLGGLLRGVAEGGGQVTWALASVHFAPETDDVPTYNSIHFTLNGTRGLIMPFVGSLLCAFVGSWTIFISFLVSAVSIFVNARNSRRPDEERELKRMESLPVLTHSVPLACERVAR